MKFFTTLIAGVVALAAAVPVRAQEGGAAPGTVELTIIPGGGLLFAGGDTESRFRNYDVGAALGYNVNRYVGVEAEGSAALGVYHQTLTVSGTTIREAPPNLFDFSGNFVLHVPGGAMHTVPYATAGLGSMLLLTHTDLGIDSSKMFLTGNAGGGLKWYSSGRWGLRADYRLVMVASSNSAPAFFGREGRYAHRIYAGVVLNLVE